MKNYHFPEYSIPVAFFIILSLMILRYFILVGVAFRLTQVLKRFPIVSGCVTRKQMKRDIYWSLLSTVIFAISGTWLITLWRSGYIEIYSNVTDHGRTYYLLSLFILMSVHDFYFYWTHRILHHPFFFKKFHGVHHESRIPSAWTAFAFHPGEAIIQAIILPVLLVIFPVHWSVLILFLAVMTLLGIINHLGYEFYSTNFRHRKPFSFLISATHHQQHHQKANLNYGLYFNWWDIWMKTEARNDPNE